MEDESFYKGRRPHFFLKMEDNHNPLFWKLNINFFWLIEDNAAQMQLLSVTLSQGFSDSTSHLKNHQTSS